MRGALRILPEAELRKIEIQSSESIVDDRDDYRDYRILALIETIRALQAELSSRIIPFEGTVT